MKKFLLIAALLLVSGCASFGRGIAEAILDKGDKAVDTRKCEIKGQNIQGLNDFFGDKKKAKVLMIHGVGTHTAGYSARIRNNLANALGLDVLSRTPKNITLVNPADGKTVIGNLQVTRMQNDDKTKDLIFYELTWSQITNQDKEIISYDYSGEYSYKRSAFNQTMKKFLDDVLPDPMVYVIDKDHLILNAAKQASCWMFGSSWNELPDKAQRVCNVSSYKQVENLNDENIVFITHSLGSRIFMDTMSNIVNEISAAEDAHNTEAERIGSQLRNKDITVFMLANQLPILQIGQPMPKVHNQIKQYCTPKGKYYKNRILSSMNIVAFSDPNDLLSYDIPQSFADTYIDSRLCPHVTNIDLNVAEEISAFGIGVVNPLAAHTEYDNDDRVIDIISHGYNRKTNSDEMNKRCMFYKLD